MIAEDLLLPDNLNYREPVSYMAARWFDEPFQADVLSKALGEKFHITSVDEDRYVHADFWFDKIGGERMFIDAKLCTRNFRWTSTQTSKTSYTDAVTIGEKAIASGAQLFSFVWRNQLLVVPHNELKSVTPFCSRISKGFNGHSQTLYHYSAESLKTLSGTTIYEISPKTYDVYDDFYIIYERARDVLTDVPFPKTASEQVYVNNIRMRTLAQFKEELIPIIKRYNALNAVPSNSTSGDSSSSDFAFELQSIMAGI